MAHNLEHTIAVLSRTPSTMNAMLRDLPEEWIHRNEGDGTFSAFDVIGHLIHGDRTDWIPRARIILEHGDTKPFEKFDRLAQVRESKGKSLPQLLDEFARIRGKKLDELRALNLTPQDFDLTHLHQVSRVMAHQYREAVGPWTRYLGVMHCNGHSE